MSSLEYGMVRQDAQYLADSYLSQARRRGPVRCRVVNALIGIGYAVLATSLPARGPGGE